MDKQLKRLYTLVLGCGWKVYEQNLNPHWRKEYLKKNNIAREYHIELESPHGTLDHDIYLAEIK